MEEVGGLRFVQLRTLQEKERVQVLPAVKAAVAEVSGVERDVEARWLCEVAAKERLGPDTLSLAVAILDRTLALSRVQKKYLNCVALASLYIAVKICEELDGIPDIGQLLRRLQSTYSTRELMRMELAILTKLKWDVCLPTVHRFLQVLLFAGGLPLSLESELRGPLECLLSQCSVSASFPASVVALSLLSVTLESRGSPSWLTVTVGLQRLLEVDQTSLIACREAVGIALGIDDKENVRFDPRWNTASPKRTKKARKRHRLSSKSADGKNARVKTLDEHFEIADALIVLYG